jgi:hypothetical protein
MARPSLKFPILILENYCHAEIDDAVCIPNLSY